MPQSGRWSAGVSLAAAVCLAMSAQAAAVPLISDATAPRLTLSQRDALAALLACVTDAASHWQGKPQTVGTLAGPPSVAPRPVTDTRAPAQPDERALPAPCRLRPSLLNLPPPLR